MLDTWQINAEEERGRQDIFYSKLSAGSAGFQQARPPDCELSMLQN